jgi:glutaredoxin
MHQPNISVYGSKSCPDTTRATRFLDSHQVAYEFKDVDESPEYNDYIAGLNGGQRVTPTIRIDNHVLINPSDADLQKAVTAATAAR